MLFIALSVLDIVAGFSIYSAALADFFAGKVLVMLTLIILSKGLWSIFTSLSAGYLFEWPGVLDIIAGLSLILISYDILTASHVLGGLIAAKGTYYFIRSVFQF